jgi:hypothetical protein
MFFLLTLACNPAIAALRAERKACKPAARFIRYGTRKNIFGREVRRKDPRGSGRKRK